MKNIRVLLFVLVVLFLISVGLNLYLFYHRTADINRDGVVNIYDLSIMMSQWGK